MSYSNFKEDFPDFNNSQRNSSPIILDDNDLLDDEWLYTSESFTRTDTFRKKMKNEGESRNSILEWLATDDDKIDSDNNSINLEDISKQEIKKKDSLNLFDEDSNIINSNSLFDDDVEISNLDSRFMSNFKLVSQDDFEDSEIEESLTKNNTSQEIHHCDSPNTEINLMDSNKIGNNEIINLDDNDSDSNMTVINTTTKNKMENLNEIEKKTEIVNDENKNNNSNDINNSEILANSKTNLLKKSEIAQKRFLAKVEEARKTIENLKPRKDSLTSEKELNLKTPKLEGNKKIDNNLKKEETFNNKKKLERRSYYYYADTGSDDEKEDDKLSKVSSRKSSLDNSDNYSAPFKKSYNYFNSGNADSSLYNDSIYNINENTSILPSPALPLTYQQNNSNDNMKSIEDIEDYPRKPPAPSIPINTNILTNMDHSNFESQQTYNSDVETDSNSSLHSDLQLPECYGNQYFSNYSKNNMTYYSTSPKSNNLYISSSPNLKPSASFIPTSPGLKPTTSFIPTSPNLKPNTSLIPTSPGLQPKKINTSLIPTSPKLKSHIPSSPTISKYSSSLYNKQKSHIASPKIGYSSPSSPTPYSKSYETHTYDPIATSYSIKDLINNKNPQMLNHSNSINSVSSVSSSSTYKPSISYSRKLSLEQNPQLKNYLNKMASSQRSKSPSMLSTTSTSSSKYSSGRKTPISRLGSHYAESTTSSTSSSSKAYSKYKNSTSSSLMTKLSTPSFSHLDNDIKTKISNIPTNSNSKIPHSNSSYSERKSKTPTPISYSKSVNESRIPSPSPYSRRSITPYY